MTDHPDPRQRAAAEAEGFVTLKGEAETRMAQRHRRCLIAVAFIAAFLGLCMALVVAAVLNRAGLVMP